jgi:hypothetical protein
MISVSKLRKRLGNFKMTSKKLKLRLDLMMRKLKIIRLLRTS